MKFLRRLWTSKPERLMPPEVNSRAMPQLRLNNPSHFARRELDTLSRLMDECLQIQFKPGLPPLHVPRLCAEPQAFLQQLEKCCTLVRDDADLLTLRAQFLALQGQLQQADEVLEQALQLSPTHFEAYQLKMYPASWLGMASYPSWDHHRQYLHPLIAAHLRQGQRVQVVRDGLQKALLVITGIRGPRFDLQTQIRLEWRFVPTPQGPLVAYYLIIKEPGNLPSLMEAFLPLFKPSLFAPLEGYFLIQQLAFTPTCFVVLVNEKHLVLNRRLDFEETALQQIHLLGEQVASLAEYLPPDKFQEAIQWHMQQFDLSQISLE